MTKKELPSAKWEYSDAAKLAKGLHNAYSAEYLLGVLREVLPRAPELTPRERHDVEFLRKCCGRGCSFDRVGEVVRVLEIMDKYHPVPKPVFDDDPVRELLADMRGDAEAATEANEKDLARTTMHWVERLEEALAKRKP